MKSGASNSVADGLAERRTSDGDTSVSSSAGGDKKAVPRRRLPNYSCMFFDHVVCRKAVYPLMGVSRKRISRIKRGTLDLRTLRRKGVASLKRNRCDGVAENMLTFFWHLYCSVAEALPNRVRFVTNDKGQPAITSTKDWWAPLPTDCGGRPRIPNNAMLFRLPRRDA